MRIAAFVFVGILLTACGGDEKSVSVENEGRIAFSSKGDEDFEIYTMRVDGSDVRQLTHNEPTAKSEMDEARPIWSPDGRSVAFMSTSDHSGDGVMSYELYVMGLDGRGQKRLTENEVSDLVSGWFDPDDGELLIETDRDENGPCLFHECEGTRPSCTSETTASRRQRPKKVGRSGHPGARGSHSRESRTTTATTTSSG